MNFRKRKNSSQCTLSSHTLTTRSPTRVAVEPLEIRVLLSGSPVASWVGAPPASHNGNEVFAQPTILVSALPSGASGASSSSVSNPAPIAGALTPVQLQQAYGFSNIVLPNGAPATGAGETIAIVDAYDDPNIQSDLHTFDLQYFGGVDPIFTKVNLGATNTINSPEQWEMEEALDVEWSHAIAPQANIMLVEAASNSYVDLTAAVDQADSLGAQVVSMSWGGGENTSFDSHFAVPNVAFVASTGDAGAPGQWPAANPNVIGVGGTSLALDSSNNWSSEVGWYGSGGSVSINESRPSYQPMTYSNGAASGIPLNKRGIPDVAYDAAEESAVSIYNSFPHTRPGDFSGPESGWFREWGTSAGAPQWAGLIALADQGRAQTGLAPLGSALALSALYANPGDFHDITSGTSTGNPNLTAAPGYDLVTGLGSPQAPLVVSSLIGVAPTATPLSPTGLSATPDNDKVSLTWNASSGATSWNVYRSSDGITYTLDATVSRTTFLDSGLTNGVGYWYQVTAVNSQGESAASSAISTTPQIPPAAPIFRSAIPSNNSFAITDASYAVTLQWTSSAGAASYNILRSNTSGSGYAVVASDVSGTTYTDTAVIGGSKYYYVIQAVSSGGAQSPNSAQLSAVTIPPPPASLTAKAGRASVALSWSAATGATSYNVLRSTTNGSGYVLVAKGVTGTSFTNTGLTSGVTYYYVIQAVDAGGPSVDSNQASAIPTKK